MKHPEKKPANYWKGSDDKNANVDILVANIKGLEIRDIKEQLLMCDAFLGEYDYLLGPSDGQYNLVVVLEIEGGVPKEPLFPR